jgi:MoaA/NifB/PqqE/SkfB family radical SAM enzyme
MLTYCSSPWNTIHIIENGFISSCFCGYLHKKGVNGNFLTTPLTELFNNSWQNDFRQSITNQTFDWCKTDCVDFYRMESVPNFEFLSKKTLLPTTIQLQIDKNCNLKCAICRSDNIYSSEVKITAYKILEKLIEEYKDFNQKVNIHCDGSGEVFASAAYLRFFNRDDLPKWFYFNIQTNGNLLTKNVDLITKLHNQIQMIEVSLDAATDTTYKEVRGGNFNIVLDGIRLLKSLGITVWTQYVVQRKNLNEILDYVKLCKKLGVDKICLQSMTRHSSMPRNWWEKNNIDDDLIETLRPILEELKQDPQIEISGGFEHLLLNKKTIKLHPLQIE